MGAAAYCDDLILLAPHRSALQKMLSTCEEYANVHNIVFSTDPNPNKSKMKCIYFCSNVRNVHYPAPVQLNDSYLPWVMSGDHLGHTLHQSGSMETDIRIKRAQYIDKTCDIRNTFCWAEPSQIIKAGDIYAGDHYGPNLWLLSSHSAEMYFKSWNTFVKLSWGVPLSTHINLVEHVLANQFVTSRNKILSRYVNYFQSLLKSSSKEVRILTRIVTQDKQSVTRQNIDYITKLSGLSPWDYGKV